MEKTSVGALVTIGVATAYMPGCIRREDRFPHDQRVLCSDCCKKMYYV